MSRGKLIVLSLCVLVLTACSAPRLTYERLDWIVGWQLGRYVELDRNQRRQFDALFQSGWDWHRARQLPVYAQDLQALSAQIDRTVSPEDLLEWQRRAESHWDRLVQRVAPQACAIVASLSDDQRDSILRRIDERIDRDRERFVERSEAEVRERAGKRLLRSLERWVGQSWRCAASTGADLEPGAHLDARGLDSTPCAVARATCAAARCAWSAGRVRRPRAPFPARPCGRRAAPTA